MCMCVFALKLYISSLENHYKNEKTLEQNHEHHALNEPKNENKHMRHTLNYTKEQTSHIRTCHYEVAKKFFLTILDTKYI